MIPIDTLVEIGLRSQREACETLAACEARGV